MNVRELLQRAAPVMPVLVIEKADDAVPLAKALAAGGLTVLEVTLRTDDALSAIRRIRDEVPEVIVGAGTLTAPAHVDQVLKAGGQFAVSPGLTDDLAHRARDAGLAYLPGVMTPSEVQRAMGLGLDTLKFFPAGKAGGVGMLKALAGPYPDIVFCPTGGIAADSKDDYLALPNVACVGGSWIAPSDAMARGDWERITRLAAATR